MKYHSEKEKNSLSLYAKHVAYATSIGKNTPSEKLASPVSSQSKTDLKV